MNPKKRGEGRHWARTKKRKLLEVGVDGVRVDGVGGDAVVLGRVAEAPLQLQREGEAGQLGVAVGVADPAAVQVPLDAALVHFARFALLVQLVAGWATGAGTGAGARTAGAARAGGADAPGAHTKGLLDGHRQAQPALHDPFGEALLPPPRRAEVALPAHHVHDARRA